MSRATLHRHLAQCLLAAGLLLAAPRPERAPLTSPGGCMPERLLAELWPPPDTVDFHPTTLEERAAFTRLVPALLKAASRQGQPPRELQALAESVGFRLEAWTLGTKETLWALREQPGRYRGAGAYLFRTGPATEDVIQSPHAYHDRGTGLLGAMLFACAPEGRRPRAFATNTAHRYRGRPGEKRRDAEHPADVAHNPEHLFHHVTELLAQGLPSLRVLQLHGFDEKRSERRDGLEAVVSACAKTPSPWARQVALRLGPLLGDGVRLYPEQTAVLGGTRNAQARLLQAWPRARFLHLELSARTRRALTTSPERLARLGDALLAPEED